MFKKVIVVLVVLAVSLIVYFIWRDVQTTKLLKLEQVSRVESALGSPYLVCKDFPPRFGRKQFSETEFNSGIRIHVYLVRKISPKFLVV